MKTIAFFNIVLASLFLLSNSAKAQNENKDIIKISYISNSISPKMLSLLREQVQSEDQYQQTVGKISRYKFYYTLLFNKKTNESLYTLDSIQSEPKVRPSGNIEFVYTDKTGMMTGKEKFMNSSYTFKDNISNIEWEISDQTKEIQGYFCKNATIKNNPDVSVWFCPEIPINRGPGYFEGLIGLVLEGSDYFGSVMVSNVEYLTDNNSFNNLVNNYGEEMKEKSITIQEVLSSKKVISNTITNKANSEKSK